MASFDQAFLEQTASENQAAQVQESSLQTAFCYRSRQQLVGSRYGNGAYNIFVRSEEDATRLVVELRRDVLTIFVFGSNLRVGILICNDNTSVLFAFARNNLFGRAREGRLSRDRSYRHKVCLCLQVSRNRAGLRVNSCAVCLVGPTRCCVLSVCGSGHKIGDSR